MGLKVRGSYGVMLMVSLLLPADAALCREDLHGVFRGGHLPGLLLPDQPHPSRGRHGIRGAEPGNHRGGLSERTRVSGGHGETEEGPAGKPTSDRSTVHSSSLIT